LCVWGQSKGDTWPNHKAPRGTPDKANVGWVKKKKSTPTDSNPRPPGMGNNFIKGGTPIRLSVVLVNHMTATLFKVMLVDVWG